MSKIIGYGSCKLYKLSEDKNEYKKLKRTLSKENKQGHLDGELINDALMGLALNKLSSHDEIYLIHDPSDIRKPHSKKTENLGKVRDLNSRIINGYSSYNVVAVTPKDKTVQLLSHELYSNKDPKFLKAEYLKKLESNQSFPEDESIQALYNSEDWFNKKTIAKAAISKTSKAFKEKNLSTKITHVLDREFDDEDYFSFISALGDDFVIRAKKSRNDVIEEVIQPKSKLITTQFDHKFTETIQKIRLKKQIYQDVFLQIEWKAYRTYTAVKVSFKDRNGQPVFSDPMLLMTNKVIKSAEDAHLIYQIYLKRSRIECVFKFLKNGLGWEEMQVQDFQSIQTLLSICFFVAAYLYEIKDQEVQDDYVVLLAKLGGGKGVVSQHYIFKGIHMMMAKHRVDRILKEVKASQETVCNMLAMAGIQEES